MEICKKIWANGMKTVALLRQKTILLQTIQKKIPEEQYTVRVHEIAWKRPPLRESILEKKYTIKTHSV